MSYINAVLGKSIGEEPVYFIDKNPAAVMIILTELDDQLQVLLTHRANSVRTHKDQVSLPGGMKDRGDKGLLQTAIRETREEIGIEINRDEIIGHLPDVKSISNYIIRSFVCYKKTLGQIIKNNQEVEKVFFIPLVWILDGTNWELKKHISSDNKERSLVFFKPFDGEIVWGITAQIMVFFANVLKW